MQKMPKVATFVLVLCLMGASEAGKLTAKYLPPHYAASSAGIGPGLLQSPSRSGAFGGGGGSGGYGRPSSQYLAPQTGHLHYHGVSAQARPQHAYQQSASRTAGLGGGVAGAPQIPILRNDYTNDANGNYNFGFDTGNGIHRDETGEFRGGWPHGSQSVKGSYSYTGDDGQVYTVNYKADGNGFRAEGAHLPTPPPIPAEIQESLALHRSNAVHGHGSGGGVGSGSGSGAYHAAASSLRASPETRYLPPAQPQQQLQQQHQGYNYGNRRHY